MGVYLRDNMGCMTDFGYVILDTNLPTFMTIQACKVLEYFIQYSSTLYSTRVLYKAPKTQTMKDALRSLDSAHELVCELINLLHSTHELDLDV